MNLKQRAAALKKELPAIFLALNDPETPIAAKFFAGITVAYALSPLDLVPDFIPVLGYLDDLLLLPALAALTVKLIPQDIMARHRVQAESLWNNGKPKKWYYAIPILLLWLLLFFLLFKTFAHGLNS